MNAQDNGPGDLNSWLLQLLMCALLDCGFRVEDLQEDPESRLAELKILPKYKRWWQETLSQVAEYGGVLPAMSGRGSGWSEDVAAKWQAQRGRFCEDEGNKATIELVEACLGALPAILSGRTPAIEVIFPDSSMHLVEGIYKNNVLMESCYEILASSLLRLVERQSPEGGVEDQNRAIRLLEIGAGTGGLTAVVLSRLSGYADRVAEYCFTDVSRSFLLRAEETYALSAMRTALLDIQLPPGDQGVPGTYDYVLAANVLHATRDIRQSLRNAKGCLRSGGYLLLNELSGKSLAAHLTFGLLDGWWSYEDADLRLSGSPAVHPDTWREVLEEEGFSAIEFPGRAYHDTGHQVIVARSNGVVRQRTGKKAKGDREADTLAQAAAPATADAAVGGAAPVDAGAMSSVKSIVVDALATSLKMPAGRIENNISFWDYGIDSILAAKFVGQIAAKLGIKMNTAVVFDHSNVNALVTHIARAYPTNRASVPDRGVGSTGESPGVANSPGPREASDTHVSHSAGGTALRGSDIAVIGMSGQFPGASNIEAFWENLIKGVDGIGELPAKYLNQEKYFAAGKVAGKTSCKWAGILHERDCFDPLFFNLAPREASSMSFHQRLVLQEGWRAIENAGINPLRLDNQPVGLYIGAEPASYAYRSFTGSSDAIIASRLSYFLNLKGPALIINTACSSSAVAIHLACEALRDSQISLALAGGVSAGIEPGTLIALSEIEMLSTSGRCRTFDAGADGTVLAEGLGIVVLKRLADAERDGDPIYGVIAGSGINQDGKSNGITSPSGSAQEELITSVYERFGIDPQHISYVEAHGTGTRLGDPVEANALVRAFRKYTEEQRYCAVGSAKAHVGHTAAAAGVVGLIKVLLSLRQQQIPGLLHFGDLNPLIEFADSPFCINSDPVAWSCRGELRMAALNSFGHSGTNAHLVIREYPTDPHGGATNDQRDPVGTSGAVLVPLSAKTRDSLRSYAARLSTFLGSVWDSKRKPSLEQIAYTLQMGREAMQERVIFLVSSARELISVLEDYARHQAGDDLYWEGTAEGHVASRGSDLPRPAGASHVATPADLPDIAQRWVQGGEIAWERLYFGRKPGRVHLPGYAFAKEMYAPRGAGHEDREGQPLHPLVHARIADSARYAYRSSFSGDEFFLHDHCFNGRRLMPAVAYLEMARKAAELSFRSSGAEQDVEIRDVIWTRPFVAQGGLKQLEIELHCTQGREIEFAMRELAENLKEEEATLAKGRVVYKTRATTPEEGPAAIIAVDERIKAGGKARFAAPACYAFFREVGMDYGERLKGIDELFVDAHELVARLKLPAAIAATADQYVLHPTVLDSAIQAAVGFILAQQPGKAAFKQGAALPIALEVLEILAPCKPDMWALVRRSGRGASAKIDTLDIDLCDSSGRICTRVRGLTSRSLADGSSEEVAAGILSPRWGKAAARQAPVTYDTHIVFLCEFNEETAAYLSRDAGTTQCVNLRAGTAGLEERYTEYASVVFLKLKEMIQGRPRKKVMVQIIARRGVESEVFLGLGSLLKTAELECPAIIGQCLLVEAEQGADLSALVKENTVAHPERQVAYLEGQRWVIDWEEVNGDSPQTAREALPWKQGGVYLISGGAGALGRIVAREIVAAVDQATVILIGRAPESEPLRSKLQALVEGNRSRIEYRQLDVTRAPEVADVVARICHEYGRIDGILHAAGISRDNFILKKTRQELEDVLAPKVRGLVNLDLATKNLDLDFFVAFSSGSAITGNPGQVDYACGNAFMDGYLQYRSKLEKQHERKGMSLAIDWLLWEEGGMQVDEATQAMLKRTMGVVPMSSSAAIRALRFGLMARREHMLVMAGDVRKFRTTLLRDIIREYDGQASSGNAQPAATATVREAGRDIERKASDLLREVVASVLELPASRIDLRAPLEKYGIDSIMIMKLTERLERDFGPLPKTLFFEYQNLQGVTSYFVEAHPARLLELLGLEGVGSQVKAAPESARVPSSGKDAASSLDPRGGLRNQDEDDIAIIGLSGRYPGAGNIDEFWTVLRDGRDCITPVRDERWAEHYSAAGENPLGSNRWGGFIEGVEKFDARFFGISPREAVLIDPQERLFLQCVYETLEDAGYSRKTLARSPAEGGGKVGVYVGVMYEEYQLYGAQQTLEGRPLALTGSPSSIANRVSYWFDFHGPSIAVDTMCSSSLTAIHMACKSLRDAECDYAIAGGVNVTVHPNKYILLAQGRFLSSSGRCESFGKGGDGYVPGEGVGAVLLKRRRQAIEDGDHIYGIIKGTAVNHGGKSNGYTVPNPVAQAEVVRSALKQAGILPRSVSYIEAHGTGTSLGDPIEVSALANVFRESTRDTQFCSIGSVKSNIGHCESAAGIAAVSKVLLQLRHRQLVPSLHSRPSNPNIDFRDTPFKVQQDLEEWRPPRLGTDGQGRACPRIAGISSFGAGGSNAHIIIAEHEESQAYQAAHPSVSQAGCLVPLSARSKTSLLQMAKNLLDHLRERHDEPAGDLSSIAYTLQVGREAMEHRLAFIVSRTDELQRGLQSFIDGDSDIDSSYQSRAGDESAAFGHLGEQREFSEAVDKWIEKNNLRVLAELWTKGVEIDWIRLHPAVKPPKIRLPTYPFELQEYWFNSNRFESPSDPGASDLGTVTVAPPAAPRREAPAGANTKVSLRELAVEGASSSSGVLDQRAARKQETPDEGPVVSLRHLDSIREALRRQLSKVLYLDAGDISVDEKFIDIGLDSITGVEWIKSINQAFGTDVAAARLYDHSTINALAKHIRELTADSGTDAAVKPFDADNGIAEEVGPIDGDVLSQLEKTLSELSTGNLTIDQAERQLERI